MLCTFNRKNKNVYFAARGIAMLAAAVIFPFEL